MFTRVSSCSIVLAFSVYLATAKLTYIMLYRRHFLQNPPYLEKAPVLWYLMMRNDHTCLDPHQRKTQVCLASRSVEQRSPCLSPRYPCICPSSSCRCISAPQWLTSLQSLQLESSLSPRPALKGVNRKMKR